jgi:hypothetical protein
VFVDVIVGRRGAGKTTLLCTLAAEYGKEYKGGAFLVQSVKPLPALGPGVTLSWNFNQAVQDAFKARPSVVLVDEFLAYKEDPAFEYVLHYGRNVAVGLVINSQRPVDITSNIRAMTNRFYLFQLTEKRDLKWIDDNIGESYVHRVLELKPFQFIIYPEEKNDGRGLDSSDRDLWKSRCPHTDSKPQDAPGSSPDAPGGTEDGPDEPSTRRGSTQGRRVTGSQSGAELLHRPLSRGKNSKAK